MLRTIHETYVYVLEGRGAHNVDKIRGPIMGLVGGEGITFMEFARVARH